jgi:two-component system response regulator HydG
VTGRVLLVDDDRALCEWVAVGLASSGFELDWRTSPDEALAAIARDDYDVIVTDLNMGAMSGLELCERILQQRTDVPVIVITAFGSMDTAISAMRAGAYDFLTKPFDIEALRLALVRAAQHRQLRDEVKRLRRAADRAIGFDDLLGESDAMRRVQDLVARVADTDSTVLITGESGTGKEVVARALHRNGRRAAGPFVAINCAAMPEPLLESELFGHARGAFTDARTARTGLFVEASGGTLFLDEIGELPIGLQPKLLRALQERVVRPIGGAREVPFDVRLVVATNRDLEAAIAERTFREDLYFRINVLHVELPPLRARGADALLLAQHFLRRFAEKAGRPVQGISSAAAERLLAYDWPGNVRELMNCIERAVALARFDELAVDDLPEKIRTHRATHVLVTGDDPTELIPLEEVERRYILRVLQAVSNNKRLAARVLGVDRKTLYRKLERYGVLAG